MKKIKITAISLTVLMAALLITPSKAEARYGMAGCGLGAMLIPENKMLHQLGASILNGIVGNQTFGIALGTLECTKSGVIKAEVEQKVYVYNNLDSLRNEMAQGNGEKLTSLAFLMGCSSESIPAFGTAMKENYSKIFPENADAEIVLSEVKGTALNSAVLSGSCGRL